MAWRGRYVHLQLAELRIYFDQTRDGDSWNSQQTNQNGSVFLSFILFLSSSNEEFYDELTSQLS